MFPWKDPWGAGLAFSQGLQTSWTSRRRPLTGRCDDGGA